MGGWSTTKFDDLHSLSVAGMRSMTWLIEQPQHYTNCTTWRLGMGHCGLAVGLGYGVWEERVEHVQLASLIEASLDQR